MVGLAEMSVGSRPKELNDSEDLIRMPFIDIKFKKPTGPIYDVRNDVVVGVRTTHQGDAPNGLILAPTGQSKDSPNLYEDGGDVLFLGKENREGRSGRSGGSFDPVWGAAVCQQNGRG